MIQVVQVVQGVQECKILSPTNFVKPARANLPPPAPEASKLARHLQISALISRHTLSASEEQETQRFKRQGVFCMKTT